ncbi:multidrug resistance protein 4 [Pholiota conissans]|uniref:Multidrug resistance protein 4 n=1 Tax=Pholiota conissans TaxID=109636 RepID=A0A9P5ZAB8_9AGAR|nr:multidrug resistance protein 4 [Pholiota conissans]
MNEKNKTAASVEVVPDPKHASISKSLTISQDDVSEATTHVQPAPEESAIPEDKKEEAIENAEDDWANDPENARNWPLLKKWISMLVVSFYTLLPPLASSMMAPGLPEVAEKYNITSSTITALTLSVFLISFALGPLVLAPVSEMYGRKWVLHIANVFTLVFSLGCAWSPTVGSLIAFRFLTGFSGSAPIAIGGGVVSDLFSERDRASAMALFSIGPLLGPALGPIAGGFVTQAVGIKWVFIVIAITCGVASLVGLPLLRETYGPVIRLQRQRMSADPEAAARAHPALIQAHGNKWHVLYVNLTRPIVMLCRSFICFILSAFMAFMYGIYYLMFSTFADFFSKTYGFGPGIGGLTYLGLGLGFIIATLFGAKFADKLYKVLADRNGGKGKPEMRIPALFIGSVFVPIGLLWFGWSAQAKIHWIMPIIGSGIFGFAMMTTYLPIQLYLIDAFTYAASAVSAASVFRSLLGFAFPLFGKQMFDALGEGGGNTLLAGIAIVLGIPFPIWIYYKGEAMRARNPLTR